MENARKIASLGYILKKESLGTIDGKTFNTLVLEDKNPFPGYYERMDSPSEHRPTFLFFVINPANPLNNDEIIRKTERIQATFKYEFDAQPAIISLYNMPHTCVRVDFNHYAIVRELIEEYKKAGVEFLKAREIEPYSSVIKVFGFFELEEKVEGVFANMTCTNKYYLDIPSHMDWETFKKITVVIKNSSGFTTFDAAQASIYQLKHIADFVRIYAEKADYEMLSALRKRYIYEIERNRI